MFFICKGPLSVECIKALRLRLEPVLPTEVLLMAEDRLVRSEIFSMLCTGYCESVLHGGILPGKYGSWKTVYSRFRRWQKRGYLKIIFELLALRADMDHILIDGTCVHVVY